MITPVNWGRNALSVDPTFFSDTRFVVISNYGRRYADCYISFLVDEFHAAGHTSCAVSSSFAVAAKADPSLAHINSSAAEGGHSVLKKIKKSFMYMDEAHFSITLYTMIQIYNRRVMLRSKQAECTSTSL